MSAARDSFLSAVGIMRTSAAFIRWSRQVWMSFWASKPALRGTGHDPLTDRISEAIRNERQRIVGELHDEALQFLMGALSSFRLAERLLEYDHPALHHLREGIQRAQVANDAIRRALRPSVPGSSGPSMLAIRVYEIVRRLELSSSMLVHVGSLPDLSAAPHVEEAVVGIITEGLANIVKHARARNLWVEVSVSGDAAHCVVRDDGIGFNVYTVESRSPLVQKLGLHLMQEWARAAGGRVTIASNPNSGTVVEARIPLR